MKISLVLLIIFLIAQSAKAQITGFSLDEDPVFKAAIAQHVHYPVAAIRGSVYGRFYVNFSIDSLGYIQNIVVVHPKISLKYAKKLGFEYAIIKGLKQLPQLTSRYKGSYVLPIAFVYINYSENANPKVPTNTLPENLYPENRLFLSEIRIVGRSDLYGSLRPVSGRAPASRQVVLF